MKKGLALLLAASMAVSSFASAAAAAELTAQEKFDALVKAGVFEGFEDGSAGLDKEMTRAQVAKIIVKLLKLDENAAGAAVFNDLKDAGWAAGFIGAVTPEYMKGYGAGKFGPSDTFTFEQLAVVLARVLDLELDASASVEGTVSDWAKAEVAAVIKAGVLTAQADYTKPALREALVVTSYAASEILAKAETPAVAYAAKAVGAKKFEVSFGTVVDTAKVAVTVKKGSIPVNVKEVKFAEDKKSATVELATNLTKGDYTITATGAAAEALTATVAAEDEKVSKIEFKGDKAVLHRTDMDKVTVGIKVSNQYGEDITDNTALTLTAGVPVEANNGVVKSNGVVTIDATSNLTLDQKISISAVHAATGTYATAVLAVAQAAKVATIEAVKLYEVDGKTPVAGDGKDYFVLLTVKDQYGNEMKDTANIADDVIVSASNTGVANVDRVDNNNTNSNAKFTTKDDKVALDLLPVGNAGTSTIFIISKTSGNKATFDVTVGEVSKVDTLTLSAPALAVAGDKVKIPFEAIDQFGKEMTKDTAIEGGLTTAISTSLGKIDFKQDYVTNKAYLELDLSKDKDVNGNEVDLVVADGTTKTAFITAVTKTGKIAQLSVTVQPNAKAAVLNGTKDFKHNYAVGATGTLKIGNIKVLDQYNRDFNISDKLGTGAEQYRVAVKSSEAGKVKLSGEQFTVTSDVYGFDGTPADGAVTFTAEAKGTSTITLELYKGTATTPIANSTVTFTSKVVEKADISSYEVEDIATLSNINTADYKKDLKVNGVLANGDKVALPSSYYTVTSDIYANGKLDGSLVTTGFDATTGEVTKSVIVTIKASGIAPIVKEVKVSNKASAIATLSLKDDSGTIKKEGDGVISADLIAIKAANGVQTIANAIVKAVDQYGVEVAPNFAADKVIVVSTTDNKEIADLVQGNTLNVTAIAQGKIINFKIIAK